MHSMLQVISHKQEAGHVQFSRNALVSVSPTGKQYLHFANRTDPQEQGHKRILHNNFFFRRWGKSQSSHRYATFLSKRGKNKTSKDYILLTVYAFTETGNIRN